MKSESGMSYEEAVKVLGLKRGETVENYEKAFDEVRKHMLRLRDEADTPEKRVNYELELTRFEEALKVAENHRPKKSKAGPILLAVLLALAALGAVVAWGPSFFEKQGKLTEAKSRLPEAKEAAKARNWTEAEKIYQDILDINPRSKEALAGMEQVAMGRQVERDMQIDFALGNVLAAKQLRNWDEAEELMAKTLAMAPDNDQLLALSARMKDERRQDDILKLTEDIELAEREEDWQNLVEKTETLAETDPENERLPEFQKLAEEAKLVLAGFREKADAIYEQALALDTGEYSEEALQLLREAQRMAPSEKAAALLTKMTSYIQTISVPKDAKTIAEALEKVRSGDKVLLAEGTYTGGLLIPAGVILAGEKGKTIIEAPADKGSVLVVEGEGPVVRLQNLVVRHSGVSNTDERYPVVLVKGSQAVFDNCEVGYGAGHGIAVIGGARCEITETEIKGCGWDGVAVVGEGSEAILQESRSLANLHHGLDVWDGGKVWVQRSRFQDNGLTGILLTSKGKECRIESSSIERNREVGVMASSGVSAHINGNLVSGNILGGIFAQDEGTKLTVTSNTIEKNGEVGLAVSKDVLLEKEEDNSAQENEGKQKWLNVDLSKIEPEKILKALPVE
jgi:tetratricopeptide (TPR) repeat protein